MRKSQAVTWMELHTIRPILQMEIEIWHKVNKLGNLTISNICIYLSISEIMDTWLKTRNKSRMHKNEGISLHKVPTESLEYFVNHIFLDLFGNKVYCIVGLQSTFFLLYNDTLFLIIASSRVEIVT